jgi:hypothetical protein
MIQFEPTLMNVHSEGLLKTQVNLTTFLDQNKYTSNLCL